jgi:tetratricopeptide (TPR) repeat protein
MYSGNYDEADEMFTRLSRSNDASYRSIGRTWMAVIPLYQGRLQTALDISGSAIEEDAGDNSPALARADKHILRAGIFREQKSYDLALKEVKSAVEIMESPISDAIRKRDELAAALADIGDFASAGEEISFLKLNTDQIDPGFRHHYWFAAGQVEYKRKDFSKASDFLRKAIASSPGQEPYLLYRAIYMLGRCYLELARYGDAVEQFRLLNFRLGHHQLYWSLVAVKKHYYLGRAYEASGWKTHAEAEYKTFLEIWKNADSGIHELEDARKRLAK